MSAKNDAIRIAVLGTPGNGKTALVVKLLSGRFIWNYDPTLEQVYKHSLVEEGEDADLYNIEVMDTAGSIEDDADVSRRDGYIKWADAFILLYSITDSQSYHAVKCLMETITDTKKLGSSVALVGNKSDLSHLRQVETSDAHKHAEEHGCLFYELSVRTDNSYIEKPFMDLCREVKLKRVRDGIKLRRRSSASQLLRKLIQKKLSI